MQFICLFIPGLISASLDFEINKKEINKNYILFISKWLIYVFIINMITNIIFCIFSSNKLVLYSNSIYTYSYCFKFMLITGILSIVIPELLNVGKNKFKIEISISKKKQL